MNSTPGGGLGRLDLHGPPLPHTLTTALALCESPELLDVPTVVRMVEHDPIVTARLLKLVNSAYYGLHRTVDNARRAVALLGPTSVLGVVVGMSMMQMRSTISARATRTFVRLVRHSLATAAYARHLGDRLGEPAHRSASLFTAGLLHDFGKMVLVYNEPEKAASLYERSDLLRRETSDEELEQEQLVFGYDHTEAGEFVARKLDFPDLLVAVIRLHHEQPGNWPKSESRTLHIVRAADEVAGSTGFAFGAGTQVQASVWRSLCKTDSGRSLRPYLASRAQDVARYVDQVTRRSRPQRRIARPLPGTAIP